VRWRPRRAGALLRRLRDEAVVRAPPALAFSWLVAAGTSVAFFLHVVVDAATPTGLMPVLGVPPPLVSYGGTAMMAVMVGFGLALGVDVHRGLSMRRHPDDDL